MHKGLTRIALAAAAAIVGFAGPALAADTIRIANSQKGFWDQTVIEFGRMKGFFAKHDLNLEILWTDGGADAQQAVIAGSMDIAFGTGILGVISAHSKGAPLEILAAAMTGASDLFWYVKADGPIKSFKDVGGKTVSFSRPGSSSNLIAAALAKEAGVQVKLVPTGGAAATMTQVMSGQIDVGWSAIPVGLDYEANGRIRIIASGNDVPAVKEQTVRVHVANAAYLEKNRAVLERFFKAYKEVLDWAYSGEEALQMYAEINKVSLDVAKQARSRGYPRESMQLFPIRGIDQSIKEAIENKRLDAPLTQAQIDKMLRTVVALEKAVQ